MGALLEMVSKMRCCSLKNFFIFGYTSLYAAALLLLSACGGGSGGNDSEPLSQNACEVIGSSSRIISGTACQDSGPIVKLTITGNEFSGTCSGTLVAPNAVLTAAHCVLENDYQSLVPAGGIIVSRGDVAQAIAQGSSVQAPFLLEDLIAISARLDPSLDPQSDEFLEAFQDEIFNTGLRDLAVVQLDRSLSLPTMPIVVSESPDEGEVLSIFGFGITDPNALAPSPLLISGQMRVDRVGRDNIFSVFDTQGSDTCRGDSGGPAVITLPSGESAVIGVTSLGFSNCQPGEVSVFAQTPGRSVQFLMSAAPGARFL
ncbi:MAG: trypsin-like serine protease [Deltaproteobacteria bacterium]|nr:trypsin-like serine protease [Deltaproteobacteria bacterium]